MERLNAIRAWFAALDGERRRWLGGAVVTAILALGLATLWTREQGWTTLADGRRWEEVLDVSAALAGANVDYKLDGNDTILVRTEDLGRARAAMATTAPLPSLGDVSDLSLGLTPQAQRWAFSRAREGDIARMINGIEGVASSQVQIVVREDSGYLDEQRPARASVFVRLERGVELEPSQIRAVVMLVANAVDGLDPESVTVADDRGHLLADGNSSDDAQPEKWLTYQHTLARRYEDTITRALLPVLGSTDAFTTAVTVEVESGSDETTEHEVDVDRPAVTQEQNEQSEDARSQGAGLTGVDANLPDRAGTPSATGDRTVRTAVTTLYDYPSTTRHTVRAAGSIRRLSVAVQVDAARVATIAGGDPAEAEKTLEAIVRAAVGDDVQRRDTVQVKVLPFVARPEEVASAEPSIPLALPTSLAGYAVGALALVLVFVFVIRPMLAVATRPKPLTEPKADATRPSAGEDVHHDGALANRLRQMVEDYEPVNAGDLSKLVDLESAASARVLRKWNKNGTGG